MVSCCVLNFTSCVTAFLHLILTSNYSGIPVVLSTFLPDHHPLFPLVPILPDPHKFLPKFGCPILSCHSVGNMCLSLVPQCHSVPNRALVYHGIYFSPGK